MPKSGARPRSGKSAKSINLKSAKSVNKGLSAQSVDNESNVNLSDNDKQLSNFVSQLTFMDEISDFEPYLTSSNVRDIEKLVTAQFNLPDADTDYDKNFMIDFMVTAVYWCKKNCFSSKQTYLCITKLLLITKLIEEKLLLSQEELLTVFRSCLVDLLRESGEENCQISNENVAKFAVFIRETVIDHFSLYHFWFHGKQSDAIITNNLTVHLPPDQSIPFPNPLKEAVPTTHSLEEESATARGTTGDATASQLDQDRSTLTPSSVTQSQLTEAIKFDDKYRVIMERLGPMRTKKIIEQVAKQIVEQHEGDFEKTLSLKQDQMLQKLKNINIYEQDQPSEQTKK